MRVALARLSKIDESLAVGRVFSSSPVHDWNDLWCAHL